MIDCAKKMNNCNAARKLSVADANYESGGNESIS
jgi:hypothetical protein